MALAPQQPNGPLSQSFGSKNIAYNGSMEFQHYSTLRNTAKERWNWSMESLQDLDNSYVAWNDISNYLGEQIWTVAAVVSDLGLLPLYRHSHENTSQRARARAEEEININLEEDAEESSIPAWEFPAETPIPIPFFASLELDMELCPRLNSRRAGHGYDYPIWSPPPLPNDECPVEKVWSQISRSRLQMSNCAPMIRAHTLLSKSRPGFQQAWRDLRQFKPFRRIGVMVWSLWRMYSVGFYSSLPRGREISTTDGGCVRGVDFRLSPYDVISRWLALIVIIIHTA